MRQEQEERWRRAARRRIRETLALRRALRAVEEARCLADRRLTPA